jgi:hypothetical protein
LLSLLLSDGGLQVKPNDASEPDDKAHKAAGGQGLVSVYKLVRPAVARAGVNKNNDDDDRARAPHTHTCEIVVSQAWADDLLWRVCAAAFRRLKRVQSGRLTGSRRRLVEAERRRRRLASAKGRRGCDATTPHGCDAAASRLIVLLLLLPLLVTSEVALVGARRLPSCFVLSGWLAR